MNILKRSVVAKSNMNMASTYMQIINAIYAGYLFCWIISQEKNKGEKKTKMKKYTLGYKCFSSHMHMIILYYIRIFDDMSRNIYLNM